MISEGKLQLDVVWDGKQITGVSIQSSRPLAACRILEGKPAVEAVRLVPLLFSVCGRAQGAAAAAACEAARGEAMDDAMRTVRERAIAGECLQEYTWRLLIDLPALLGEAARPGELADLRRRIATAKDELRWNDVAGAAEELLERAVYEMSPRVWLGLRPAAFEKWVARGDAPMQRMLARLRQLRLGGDFGLLPWLEAADLLTLSARLDAAPDFAQLPNWQGEPAETGALARQLGHPALAREIGQYGVTVAARLLARLLELAQLPEQLRQPQATGIRSASPRPGSGIAAVETARGRCCIRCTRRRSRGALPHRRADGVEFPPAGRLRAAVCRRARRQQRGREGARRRACLRMRSTPAWFGGWRCTMHEMSLAEGVLQVIEDSGAARGLYARQGQCGWRSGGSRGWKSSLCAFASMP